MAISAFPELDIAIYSREDNFYLKIGNHEIGRNPDMPNFWVSDLMDKNKTEKTFPEYVHTNLMHVVAMVCAKELDYKMDEYRNDLIEIMDTNFEGVQNPEP